ncbi:hybrid sensor histidine kinase/response regulator transcription factor [Pedobacter arcticus]|uniref:hybrid sensor histidine kinase/response regulator transcription factor n=1 Tax=Pedobacter arcticus TaxID=752140 RepID=UPI0002DF289E|nr:two-component regulator propeller domain-containing protein [Pedobacter arcticus]
MFRYILILSILFSSPLVAQTSLSERRINVDQGLSNSSINTVFQDKRGFIWIGTHDGLNRYNGKDFKVYRHQFNQTNSIDGNWVACIAEDKKGKIWVGTSRGLNIYDPVSDSFSHPYLIRNGLKELLQSNITAVKVDAQGNIFATTTNGGLLTCKNGENVLRQVTIEGLSSDEQSSFPASAMVIAKEGIWVTGRNVGLLAYSYKTKSLHFVDKQITNNNALALDDAGRLWLANDDGLYQYNRGKLNQVYTSRNRLVNLAVKNRTLWISSDGDGVLIKQTTNLDAPKNYDFQIPIDDVGKSIFCIYPDREGRVWVGTLRHGGILIDSVANGIWDLKNITGINSRSLLDKEILSLGEDKNKNIWIGTDGYGLGQLNLKTKTLISYSTKTQPSLSSNYITSILTDKENRIWISTWGGGVLRYEEQSNTFKHYDCINPKSKKIDKNTWKLFQDRSGKIWLGTCLDGALYTFDNKQDAFVSYDTKLVNILSFFEDDRKQLWAGTYEALIKIDKVNMKHSFYHIGSAVRDIKKAKDNKLWLATEGGGLQQFDTKTHRIIRLSEANGLANNSVLKIISDRQGNLWLNTLDGISIFNLKSKNFNTIDTGSGLLSNELSYNASLNLSNGYMLFGGIKGLNIINPESFKNYYKKHKIFLTGLLIDHKPIANKLKYITKQNDQKILKLEIPFSEATILLNFSSPIYSNKTCKNYAYYLEGWDKTWSVEGKNQEVIYNRLAEGTYHFKVKLSEQGNLAKNEETLLTIVVLPPIYRTWWAYLIYVLAVALLIYTFIRYRSRQIRLAYEVDFARLQVVKEKDLNEKKMTFFTNISHEFRTPLTLILNPLQELMGQNHPTADLDIAYRSTKRLMNLVDQLLLFRKVENEFADPVYSKLDFVSFCKEIYSYFTQQTKSKNIEYTFLCDFEKLDMQIDREKTEIALFNILGNAVKFTSDGGKISLKVRTDEKQVLIEVKDNGIGIGKEVEEKLFDNFYQIKRDKKVKSKGFGIGLYLAKKIIEQQNGTISYQSELGKGTVFYISLPLFNKLSGEPTDVADTTFSLASLGEIISPEEIEPSIRKEEKKIRPNVAVSEKKSLLIIDDNTEIRQYIKNIFSANNIIYEADNGISGLDMAQELVPDLIISDLAMPGLTGAELCRKVKEDINISHIPIVLLTGDNTKEAKLDGIESGAVDYIVKPFDKALLVAKITSLLENSNRLQQYFLETVTLQNNNSKVPSEFKYFLDRCITIIESNIDNSDFNVQKLATEMGMSHSNLYKKVKTISGLTVNGFIRSIRLRKAAVLMLKSNYNINQASFEVGIADVKHFRLHFFNLFGMKPSEYIRKYRNNFNQDGTIVR